MSEKLISQIDPSLFMVKPGRQARLSRRDPRNTQGLEAGKKEARKALEKLLDRASDLQERLYAEGRHGLLLVIQAMDTGGKDSTIRSITNGLNPQGCQVYGFKAPSKIELAHDYLWRVHAQVPPKGIIGIFNRSHYEDVLIVRVHGWASPEAIEQRYGHINDFERLLHDTGTRIVKVMLHISKEYQLEQLRDRVTTPRKNWKFNPDDLKERAHWNEYMRAYELALTRCSTDVAPWYVVPAENKWFRNLLIARLMVDNLEALDPQFPKPSFDPAEFAPETLV